MSLTDDLMAAGLRVLTEVAGSPLLDKAGVREQFEKALFDGARESFNAVSRATTTLNERRGAKKPGSGNDDVAPATRKPRLFDLQPTDEQEMMQETVRRFAADNIRDLSRRADDETALPSEIVESFEALGVKEMLIPEEYGGYAEERSPLTTALILDELAYGDMGVAYALYASLSVLNALVDFGSDAQKSKWIEALASDGANAAIAFMETQPLFDPFAMTTRAKSRVGGFTISGKKTMVARAASCDFFLVAANVKAKDTRLFLVPADAPGVTVKAAPAMGLRCAELGEVTFDKVAVDSSSELGEGSGAFSWNTFVQSSRTASAALATGTARAVVDFVGPYANERKAFGEPISHRQSVAFLIADMALETEALRLHTWRAASQLEYGRNAEKASYLAHLFAAEKGMYVGTSGVQVLGGHGFVKEYLMELWYRNLRGAGIMQGGLYL